MVGQRSRPLCAAGHPRAGCGEAPQFFNVFSWKRPQDYFDKEDVISISKTTFDLYEDELGVKPMKITTAIGGKLTHYVTPGVKKGTLKGVARMMEGPLIFIGFGLIIAPELSKNIKENASTEEVFMDIRIDSIGFGLSEVAGILTVIGTGNPIIGCLADSFLGYVYDGWVDGSGIRTYMDYQIHKKQILNLLNPNREPRIIPVPTPPRTIPIGTPIP